MSDYTYIRHNLDTVLERIERAASAAGVRAPSLLCVTKSATEEEMAALCGDSRVEHIGENRVQQFCARYAYLEEHGVRVPPFHIIGSLQTNKVKYVVGQAAMIQSVDSLRLAVEIDRQSAKKQVRTDILLEVNSGREPNKGGIMPEELFALHEEIHELQNVRICGLMTMAPVCADADGYRPYFAATRRTFERLRDEGGFDTDAPVLSMGMSDSFEPAIAEGSTLIRVGRALFAKP